MRDNDSSTMFAGGIILVIIVMMACLKAIQKIFTELSLMFEAMGKMAESFLSMAWHGALAISLISLGIGCVLAAGYFTYKYYLMVKRGTEIQNAVDDKIHGLMKQLNSTIETLHRDNNERIWALESKLKAALDKPAIAPTQAQANLLPEPKPKDTADNNEPGEPITDLSPTVQNESPQNVDNPF